MKFTNEQAFESLKGELTNKGRKTLRMSERTLKALTDNLVSKLADEEMGLPDFVETAMDFLNPVNDNIGKDKSDFIKAWEKEHPSTDPIPEPTPQPPTEDPRLKEYEERIAALEKDKQESEKRASLAQKRSDLAAKLKGKGVNDDEWINSMLSKVNLDRDFDMDAETEDFVKLYNKSRASGGGAPAPGNPGGKSAQDAFKASIAAAASLAKRERTVIEPKN